MTTPLPSIFSLRAERQPLFKWLLAMLLGRPVTIHGPHFRKWRNALWPTKGEL